MVHVLIYILDNSNTYMYVQLYYNNRYQYLQLGTVPCWYFKVQPYSPIKKLRSCIQIQYRRYDTQVPRYNYGCTCTSSCLKVPVLSYQYSGTNNLQLYLGTFTYSCTLMYTYCSCTLVHAKFSMYFQALQLKK